MTTNVHRTIDSVAALYAATGEIVHDLRIATPATTCCRSSNGSTPMCRVTSRCTLCWTLSAQSAEPVRDWLALPTQARWHRRFTPTGSLSLNLVECWFSVLTRNQLTNSAFRSACTRASNVPPSEARFRGR